MGAARADHSHLRAAVSGLAARAAAPVAPPARRRLPRLLLSPLRNPIWAQFLFHKLLRFLTPYCALAIGAWCLITTWPRLTAPLGTSLSAAAAALLCLLVLSADRAGRVRHMMGQAVLLQAAVLVATFKGLRGRWDVWQK